MLTRVGRVIIRVANLDQAAQTYTNLGFELDVGPTSAVARNSDDCLELLCEAHAKPDGLQSVVIESDDLISDVAAMRGRGVDIGDVSPAGDGMLSATPGPASALPIQFVQMLRSAAERHVQPGAHPNGVIRLDRAYMVTPDLTAALSRYATALGMPVPPIERGQVIQADMAIFNIGGVGIGVAMPVDRGPAATALEKRGPGPFQALYRTRSMGAAVRWMVEHGVPPPARGIRNTGEQAILIADDQACGTFLVLVGPE